jgi:hypothetical protein
MQWWASDHYFQRKKYAYNAGETIPADGSAPLFSSLPLSGKKCWRFLASIYLLLKRENSGEKRRMSEGKSNMMDI